MAISLGTGGGNRAPQMNVTPLIDVLLVLIIIFMLILPKLPKGLKAQVPQPPDQPQRVQETAPDQVVLTVFADQTVQLNQEAPVALDVLDSRLRKLFQNATHHVIFVRGAKTLDFQNIAQVIDIAKGVGLERVALMTE